MRAKATQCGAYDLGKVIGKNIDPAVMVKVATKSALQNPYNPHECWRYGVNADDGISQESLSEGIFSGGFA
jgi:hypothetical protein